MAVPARFGAKFVIQDDRGFRSNVRINAYLPHIDTVTTPLDTVYTDVAAIGTALAAMTNAKVVSTGFFATFDIAQEPSSETGTYQLVEQKAALLFGDGNTLKERIEIPAPIDGLFLTTTQDNLVVVDPTAATLTAFQAAVGALFNSPTGGVLMSQFFGGQLVGGKPRRRRVLQGA
jgi:hypothetical protein